MSASPPKQGLDWRARLAAPTETPPQLSWPPHKMPASPHKKLDGRGLFALPPSPSGRQRRSKFGGLLCSRSLENVRIIACEQKSAHSRQKSWKWPLRAAGAEKALAPNTPPQKLWKLGDLAPKPKTKPLKKRPSRYLLSVEKWLFWAPSWPVGRVRELKPLTNKLQTWHQGPPLLSLPLSGLCFCAACFEASLTQGQEERGPEWYSVSWGTLDISPSHRTGREAKSFCFRLKRMQTIIRDDWLMTCAFGNYDPHVSMNAKQQFLSQSLSN